MKLFKSAGIDLDRLDNRDVIVGYMLIVGVTIQEVHQTAMISSVSTAYIFISLGRQVSGLRLHAVRDSTAQVRQVNL